MPTFFELHSQKNILCEWYSYLENVTLGESIIFPESIGEKKNTYEKAYSGDKQRIRQ